MLETLVPFDLSLLTLGVLLAGMALVMGLTVGWGVLHARADRLPAATRLVDVREQLAVAQAELARKKDEIRELDQRIHDRDRIAAEVEVLQRRVEELRLELENLAAAREEIEQVKKDAAEAARLKAELEAEVMSLRQEAERVRADIDPVRIDDLRRQKEEAEAEMSRVRGELERVRPELEMALRHLAEAREAEARVAALTQRLDDMQAESAQLRDEQTALVLKRDETAHDLANAQEQLASAEAGRRSADAARDEADRKRADIENRIAGLEETLEKLRKEPLSIGPGPGQTPPPPVIEVLLADLVAQPSCLAAPVTTRRASRPETEALHGVGNYLRASGLTFSSRTIRAFHTALKVNDTAQLTVLAGVSGTGKSLLPRRYAEAMGIHFSQVAVEPRWDSPQDLLGFYNYVEGKYRATELARLMAHLDPWQTLPLPEKTPDRRDHMALVLLDEMNLARVEYYFSEFLSRLEARPAWRAGLSKGDCENALIPVDIRGLSAPPRLFPAHNILFVGTMNDDESTQSLSDKVLDRGNILQFPAPAEFPPPSAATTQAHQAEAQRFTEWRGWVKAGGSLPQAQADQVRETVAELSGIMQGFGKPFGHRLNQAILAYVANYPAEGNGGLNPRFPLSDQLEFRILPKLRGIEIDSHRDRFEALTGLIRSRLNDDLLADRLAETCEDQARGSNAFFWRGLMRQD
jgi:hypothetical protein